MSDLAWIMTGIGIMFATILIFMIFLSQIFYEGWKLVHSLTFLWAGIFGGAAMVAYGINHFGPGRLVCIIIGLVVIIAQYVYWIKKTRGMKKEESEQAVIKEQRKTGKSYLVGCDTVEEEEDGYHYTFTIVWQEKGSSNGYYHGKMIMTSDTRFLEPGKVYLFYEEEMMKLGKDHYASMSKKGADITGISQEAFVEANRIQVNLMNTVMNVLHKEEYGTYEEGTVLEKVEKVQSKVSYVKRIMIGVGVAFAVIVFLIISVNEFMSIKHIFSLAKSDNTETVTARVESVEKTEDGYEYTLQYTYDGKDYETTYVSDSLDYDRDSTVNIKLSDDNLVIISSIGADNQISASMVRRIVLVLLFQFVFAAVCVSIIVIIRKSIKKKEVKS